MPYNKTQHACNNCGEITDIFYETPPNIDWKYKYTCPHCNKESTFKGSISFLVEKIPGKAIFAKVVQNNGNIQ